MMRLWATFKLNFNTFAITTPKTESHTCWNTFVTFQKYFLPMETEIVFSNGAVQCLLHILLTVYVMFHFTFVLLLYHFMKVFPPFI